MKNLIEIVFEFRIKKITGDGAPIDIGITIITSFFKERFESVMDVHVALTIPSGLIHLVDQDDQMTDTHAFGKESMFSGLSILFETTFELTLFGRNHQAADIGLTGTLNHIGDIILMSGRINNGVPFVFGLKECFADLHSLASCAFFLSLVHDVSQVPTFTVVFLGFHLELLELVEVHLTGLEQNLTT
jgi:hypothetical protein